MPKSPVRFLLAAAAVTLAAFAVLPATVLATTYCVGDAACVSAGGTNENGLVQHALDDAQAHPGLDRVQIGSGTFTGTGFTYQDASPGNGVQIVGAGRALTTLSTTAASTNVIGLQGGASTVQDLSLSLPGKDKNYGLFMTGASTVQRVDVTAAAGATHATAIHMAVGGTLSDIDVTLTGDNLDTGIEQIGGAATVSDVLLDVPRAITASATAATVYRRVKMIDTYAGLHVTCGNVTLEDSSIRLKSGLVGVDADPSPAPSCPGATDNVTLRHVTLDGDGLNAPQGIESVGGAGATVTFSLRDSILTNVTTAIDRQAFGGTINISLDYVDFNPANDIDSNTSGGTGHISATHSLNVAPGFVSATDDHLAAASPLVDAGSPAGLAPGESTLDLGGGPRILDAGAHPDCAARQDIGAYERPAGGPGSASAAASSPITAGVPATFTGTACSPDPGAGLTFAWDFGDGGTGAGQTPTHTFADAGTRIVTLTVTDADGRVAERTIPVTVLPAAGSDPGPGPGPGTKPPPGPAARVTHCHVPKLRGVSLAVARRRLAGAHCRVGKISHAHRPGRTGAYVVRASTPRTGTTLGDRARVRLSLIRRARRSRHRAP